MLSLHYLKRDGGVGLDQEVAIPLTRLRVNPDLELLSVIPICLLKVGSGKKSWGLHLALGHILDSGGQVVLITLVVLGNIVIVRA